METYPLRYSWNGVLGYNNFLCDFFVYFKSVQTLHEGK